MRKASRRPYAGKRFGVLSIAFGLFASAVSSAVFAQDDPGFLHPGALNTASGLDRARARIAEGQEPWASILHRVEQKAQAPGLALTVIDAEDQTQAAASQAEAVKAYANALAWRLTGNRKYSRRAIAILNLWANLRGFVGKTDQDKLHAGWIGALFGEAAEVMRESPDWSTDDIAALQAMFRRAFYPQLLTASHWNGNVDLTQIDALMTISVFNDDVSAFKIGLQRLEARSKAYIFLQSDFEPGAGDHRISPAVWFDPVRWVDGLTQETCRDNGHHAQFGLASALHAAEIAWNQGVDVYTPQTKRFTAAMELLARQLLTGDMQGTCANAVSTDTVFNTFEVGFNHYHYRVGLPLPFTERLISERVRPDGASELNIFHETLTHGANGEYVWQQ
ncbi:alginate lyase family protein [Sphingomonas daechungensis]|uniref:alginate lyase family protein n=1 Tax=Sphingomonas daechungensis TaxID=1176646 RepID=UPI001CB8DEF6|nr:alginate lyase family protein [Sphingomonas daechungensis]